MRNVKRCFASSAAACALGIGRRQRFDIALQRHDLLLKPQVVDAGINLALHQRRGDVPLFNGKRKAAFGLAFPAGQFFDFARALLILRLQQAHFGVLLLFAGMEDGHLVSDGLRVRNRQFFREGGRFAFQLGVKADDRKLVLQDPVLGVAVLALGKFVVELRKRRALFNDFPFTDQDGPQDTAFKVLDDLRALRRNDLPVGVGHLIDFGKVRPDAQNEEKEADSQ